MTEKILGKNGVSVIRDVIKDKADSVHAHTASDITDFPEIPTEETVEKWGFTKNSGDYSKPTDGIPKSDLSSDVQASLDKADTALQSYTEKYTGTYSKPNDGIPKSDLSEEVQDLLEKSNDTKSYDVVVTGEKSVTIDGLQEGVPFLKISIPYITGKNHFIVSTTEKNDYNKSITNNGNGTFSFSQGTDSPNIYFKDYIPILPNTPYCLSTRFNITVGSPLGAPYNDINYTIYDKDKIKIRDVSSSFLNEGSRFGIFTITEENACFVKFYMPITNLTTNIPIPQLELGAIPTNFEIPTSQNDDINSLSVLINDKEYVLSSFDYDISSEGIMKSFYVEALQKEGINTITVLNDNISSFSVYGTKQVPFEDYLDNNINTVSKEVNTLLYKLNTLSERLDYIPRETYLPMVLTGSFTTTEGTYTITFPNKFPHPPIVTAICTTSDSTNKTGSISISEVTSESATFVCYRGTGTSVPSSTYPMTYSWTATYMQN